MEIYFSLICQFSVEVPGRQEATRGVSHTQWFREPGFHLLDPWFLRGLCSSAGSLKKEQEGEKATCLGAPPAQKGHVSLLHTVYWLTSVTWSHWGARGSGKCSHFSAATLLYGKRITNFEVLWPLPYHLVIKILSQEKLPYYVSTHSHIKEVSKNTL